MACGDKKNIFRLCRMSFGSRCFMQNEVAAKVRNALYRHIRGNCNYGRVVQDIVRDGLSYFYEEVSTNEDEGCTLRGTDFDDAIEVLYICAHLCQKYDVNNQELVQKVLLTVFEATRSFDPWFEFLDQLSFVFEIETNVYPFSYKDEEGHITKQRLDALEYFLKHAAYLTVSNVCFQNLAFGSGAMEVRPLLLKQEVTFVDSPLQNCRGCTPLLLACHSSSPEAVLLLLRYGASPLAAPKPNLPTILAYNARFHQPLYVLVSKLNALMFWRTHGFHEQTTDDLEKLRVDMQNREEKLIECLEIFKRAMRSFPVIVTHNISSTYANPEIQHIHPHFKNAVQRGPGSLLHIARHRVRKCLKDNAGLPSGIEALPLPRLLREYIDLKI